MTVVLIVVFVNKYNLFNFLKKKEFNHMQKHYDLIEIFDKFSVTTKDTDKTIPKNILFSKLLVQSQQKIIIQNL